MNTRSIIAILFLLSGLTGLIYEIVWIRLFAIAFSNTAQALSTVLSVYLGGLTLGAWYAGRFASGMHAESRSGRCLRFYGLAEITTGVFALLVPALIHATEPALRILYANGHGQMAPAVLLRAILCSAILVPATMMMGASLPLLAGWARSGARVGSLYTLNLAGATAGALLSGFVLLPTLGFTGTLRSASLLNVAVGGIALWVSKQPVSPVEQTEVLAKKVLDEPPLAPQVWITAAFLSGMACMLYEVVWGRIYGLLFGPTSSTVTLVLAAFLAGLTAGGIAAQRLKRNLRVWLCSSQFACSFLLLWSFVAAGTLPGQVAEWVRLHNANPSQIELMKTGLLIATLLPLTTAIGMSFPLLLRLVGGREAAFTGQIGGVYGINTAGCIAGALAAGWLLIPALGTQRTLLLGALVNIGLGLLLFFCIWPARRAIALIFTLAGVSLAIFAVPRWDMAAMTAGAYKYAPYYASGSQQLDQGELVFLREGVSGTVAVRKEGRSLLLSIGGKVDASDAGGDLLTEKLLAHLPLLLAHDPKRVCLIGLASGVTAGAVLTHPVQSLDVVEVSRDVVSASQFFDAVNRRALADPRTSLILNDGRNHLALTSSHYDVIISEPSNPWIAGMNNLFTLDFFRIAKQRLSPGGIFAQWFHVYNMPKDDLQSLLQAFEAVFPSSILWQLNDGDVLLTGFAGDASTSSQGFSAEAPAAAADLVSVGVSDPQLLLNLYVMRDNDIRRFAGTAAANTDDNATLEFHGQRDLHAQTDISNVSELAGFAKQLPPPPTVQAVQARLTPTQLLSTAHMFEVAESYRSAFHDYRMAFLKDPKSLTALAGMDRTARLPEERGMVSLALGVPEASDSLEKRTELALEKARNGDIAGAQFLFEENADANPLDSAARVNYGLFCLERKEYTLAVEQFRQAIELNSTYLPAYEAMAESYLQLHDVPNAVLWSRRILQLDPNHDVARRTLSALERNH